MTDTELISLAAQSYCIHAAWRQAGQEPWRCPEPTAERIVEQELDARGITERPERGIRWAVLIGSAFELAEPQSAGTARDRPSTVEVMSIADLPFGGRIRH